MPRRSVREILEGIAPAYWLSYSPSDLAERKTPLIVFSRVSSGFGTYRDDLPGVRTTTYQVNVVSSGADEAAGLSAKLEAAFEENGMPFSLTSEYANDDGTISTVYETRTEEIR